MRSPRALVLIIGGLLVLAALFLILRPPATGQQDRALDVRVSAAEMTPAEIRVGAGDTVTLSVSSDREIRFHLHGYDLVADVRPGVVGILEFRADRTGRFEIEDELSEKELGTLIVEPR